MRLPSSSQDGEAHGLVEGASVSNLPELRRYGGVPILLEFGEAIDLSPYFQSFHDASSDEANKTPSSTVDGKAHGSGDDATVSDLPEFRRNGGDPMGRDFSDVDLTPYLFDDTFFTVAFAKRTSRL
jgi:hypothetical protein